MFWQISKVNIPKSKWFKNPLELTSKNDVDVVVELIGGSDGMAKKVVFSALKNKKHVITANKALIAKYGDQLAFIAEKNTLGLTLSKPEKKMGWRGSDTRSVFFENMEIPKENMLGNPSKGFKQFLQTLVGGRITIGALSLGTAQGAYQLALNYSKEREAFGKKINHFQAVSF